MELRTQTKDTTEEGCRRFTKEFPSIQCPLCHRPWRININDVTSHGRSSKVAAVHDYRNATECLDDAVTSLSKRSSSTLSKPSRSRAQTITRKQRKNALDLDRHCGVIIAPSGAPCMRSVTCKSHSLASKRAVIGRSRDFDTLLAQYVASNPTRPVPSKLQTKTSSGPEPLVSSESILGKAKSVGPFVTNVRVKASGASWLRDNVKIWTVEPLRLFCSSRRGQSDSVNK